MIPDLTRWFSVVGSLANSSSVGGSSIGGSSVGGSSVPHSMFPQASIIVTVLSKIVDSHIEKQGPASSRPLSNRGPQAWRYINVNTALHYSCNIERHGRLPTTALRITTVRIYSVADNSIAYRIRTVSSLFGLL